MEVSVPSWYRIFFNADILCNSIFSLNISLNSLLRTFNLKKRYKSCRYWLLIVPGRSENLFRVSALDCSANSSACCSVSWLKIRLRCDCGNCLHSEEERILITAAEESRLQEYVYHPVFFTGFLSHHFDNI